jgi:hypothetical protein
MVGVAAYSAEYSLLEAGKSKDCTLDSTFKLMLLQWPGVLATARSKRLIAICVHVWAGKIAKSRFGRLARQRYSR